MDEEGRERLAKVLAARGVASRREAEAMIEAGRVMVNGVVATHPGLPTNPRRDHIKIDGKGLPRQPGKVYLILNKPKGYITGRNDPKGRRSVLDLLGNLPERLETVGRLDFNTEGALLLTNDGDLAYALTHPSKEVPKRYIAKVYRCPSEKTISRLEAGIQLEDGKTAPCKMRVLDKTDKENAWVELTITEGKNRLVRRMLAAVGHPVSKLRRESFATISVRELPIGTFRPLTGEEVARLRDMGAGVHAASAGKKSRPSKVGFAKADPEWLAKRLDGKKGRVNRGLPPRGGAAR